MNTTTLIGMTGVSASLTNYTVGENGQIDKGRRNDLIATTITTSATIAVGGTLNDQSMQQIHSKYANAYVESLSDEQLERALQQLNLLEEETEKMNCVKTI